MAFLRLAFFPGGTSQHWAAVRQAVGAIDVPRARRAFAAGPTEGGWQVMQLWDTREDLERFNHDVYLPAIDGLGDIGFPQAPLVRDVVTVDGWIGQDELS